jgi:hypothetical protein
MAELRLPRVDEYQPLGIDEQPATPAEEQQAADNWRRMSEQGRQWIRGSEIRAVTPVRAAVARTRAILHPRDRRGRFADRISASMTPKPGWQPIALVDDVADALRSTGEASLPDGSWARRQRDRSIRVHTADGRETTIKKSGMLDRTLGSWNDAQMAATVLLHASAHSTRRRSLGGARSFAGGLWDAGLRLEMGGGGHTHEMGVATAKAAGHRGMNGPSCQPARPS